MFQSLILRLIKEWTESFGCMYVTRSEALSGRASVYGIQGSYHTLVMRHSPIVFPKAWLVVVASSKYSRSSEFGNCINLDSCFASYTTLKLWKFRNPSPPWSCGTQNLSQKYSMEASIILSWALPEIWDCTFSLSTMPFDSKKHDIMKVRTAWATYFICTSLPSFESN